MIPSKKPKNRLTYVSSTYYVLTNIDLLLCLGLALWIIIEEGRAVPWMIIMVFGLLFFSGFFAVSLTIFLRSNSLHPNFKLRKQGKSSE